MSGCLNTSIAGCRFRGAQSIDIPHVLRLYFSTLRPAASGICRLLLPLDDALAVGAVLGSVACGRERLSASGAAAEVVFAVDLRLQLRASGSFSSTCRKYVQHTDAERICGQTTSSPSSSSRQFSSSQLQHLSVMIRTASRCCFGVIRYSEPSGFRSIGGTFMGLDIYTSFPWVLRGGDCVVSHRDVVSDFSLR